MDFSGRIDLHMHTQASDGTDTPAGIVTRVKEAGISLFAVTDHDTIDSCAAIGTLLQTGDPAFICGVEFSCKDEDGRYHILGYGFDGKTQMIDCLLRSCHASRMLRVQQRLDFLRRDFGFVFSPEDVDGLFAQTNPGKPHIANLMVKYGFAPNKEVAIKEFINRYKEAEQRVRPEYVVQAIIEAGGIPVLAHPSFGSGAELIVGEEMEKRLLKLISFGLQGVEAYYSGFSASLRNEMLAFADKYDLYVTAGSDYHGTNKPVRLGETHLEVGAEYPKGLMRFLEACPTMVVG